jgi:hypothetical protein
MSAYISIHYFYTYMMFCLKYVLRRAQNLSKLSEKSS